MSGRGKTLLRLSPFTTLVQRNLYLVARLKTTQIFPHNSNFSFITTQQVMEDNTDNNAGIVGLASEIDESFDEMSARLDRDDMEVEKQEREWSCGNIRRQMEQDRQNRWGLAILRCTYNSQERWDKYLSLIHEHLEDYRIHEEDSFLKDSMCFPVIEDRGRLDGATWKEARKMFDEWVVKDMKANPPGPPKQWNSMPTLSPIEEVKRDINRSPYWMYFVYADEASVTSVLECVSQFPDRSPNDYWTTIVASAIFGSRSCKEDENGVVIHDFEDPDDRDCPVLYRRVKITELSNFYGFVNRDIDKYYQFDHMFEYRGFWATA